MRMVRSVVVVAWLVLALGLWARVAALEAHELDARGETLRLLPGEPLELVRAELAAEEEVRFEVCASTPDTSWLDGARFEVLTPSETVLAVEGGALGPNLRRNAHGACGEVAHGVLREAANYALTVRTHGTSAVALRGRIVASRPVAGHDRIAVAALTGLSLLLALLIAGGGRGDGGGPRWLRAVRARREETLACAGMPRRTAWLLGSLAILVGVMVVLPRVFVSGAASGVLAGWLLGAAELGVAVAILGRERLAGATTGPRAWLGWAAVAVLSGLGLRAAAALLLSNIESTGEAPIEAFVAWPSGSLSFALIAVTMPLAEEGFFRGLVQGLLDRGRGAQAFGVALSTCAFAAAHLGQVWGNWGGMLSIALAGFVFALLRAASGSTGVSALAHLTYNGLLTVGIMAGPWS